MCCTSVRSMGAGFAPSGAPTHTIPLPQPPVGAAAAANTAVEPSTRLTKTGAAFAPSGAPTKIFCAHARDYHWGLPRGEISHARV
jgi:hypothetical protein